MSPRQAKKLAGILMTINGILVLIVIPLAIKLGVDYFLPKPTHLATMPSKQERPTSPQNKPALDDFRVCWNADILETAPKLPDKTNDTKPKPPVIRPEQLPFEWVWAIPNSDPDKSFVVLADRGTKKQILAKQGAIIGGTNYRVIAIENDQVKLALGDMEAILPRPQPQAKSGITTISSVKDDTDQESNQ